MRMERKYFPPILPDNEEMYFQHLSGILDSVDELSMLQVTKLSEGYLFRLSPSLPKYNSLLIEELLKFHNVYNIRLDMSKSIKSSGVLTFKINL